MSSKKVVIVGGYENMVRDIFEPKLSTFGVEILAQIEGNKRAPEQQLKNIPQDCDGIIIVNSAISHPLSHVAVMEAKKRGIPFCCVPHKWSKAERYLNKKGIIAMSEKKESSFNPLLKSPLPPTVLIPESKPKAPAKPIESVKPSHSEKEVREVALLLIEEDPALVQSMDKLVQELKAFGIESNLPNFTKAVETAIAQAKENWLEKSDKAYKQKADSSYRWAVGLFKDFQAGNGEWPTYRLCREKSKALFGTLVDWNIIKEARKEVIGDWAYEVCPLKNLYGFFPEQTEDWQKLAAQGKLLSVKIGPNRLLSSKKAAQLYLNNIESEPKTTTKKSTPSKVNEFQSLPGLSKAFEKEMARIISEAVKAETAPLLDRIQSLESKLLEMAETNKKPKNLKITGLSLILE